MSFPVPRITESFIDGVMQELGWCRFLEKYSVEKGQANADYLGPNAVAELKIFEDEALLKKEHQKAIASIFDTHNKLAREIDLELEQIPDSIRKLFEDRIARPFQSAIKKASAQLKTSAEVCGATGEKVIIAVNNGYSYLNAEDFERVFVSRAKRDSKSIDHAVCITVEHHKGAFDTYVLCTTRVHQINSQVKWKYAEEIVQLVGEAFENAMTIMMRDMMDPELWKNSVPPVRSIRFNQNGVEYIREPPKVPDSRFD